MLKKHMFPLNKDGQKIVHKGKGSQMAPMPSRGEIDGLAKGPDQSMNDYAKATPMPQPVPDSMPGWPDNGM